MQATAAHVTYRYVSQYVLQLDTYVDMAQLQCAVDDISALQEKSGIDLSYFRAVVSSHRSRGGDDRHFLHTP